MIAAALLSCFIAAAASRPAPQEDALHELLAGVEEIASPGVPGSLCVFGPDARVVVADARGVPVVAAVDREDAGRIVAFAHGGYLGEEARSHGDTARLLAAAETWASRGGTVEVVVTGGALSGLDGRDLAERVRAGTGLVVAATGWGWCQLNPGRDIATDLPANALLLEHGLAFGTETTRDSGPTGFLATPPPQHAHAGSALRALLTRKLLRDEEKRLVEARLLEALGCLPADEPLLVEPLTTYLDAYAAGWGEGGPRLDGAASDRLAIRLLHDRWSERPPDEVPVAPTAATFPGSVEEGAPREVRRIPVGPARGWHSTGLYAPPGEVLEAIHVAGPLPPGVELRIGCHTDRLWSKDAWKRWPEISRAVPLVDGGARIASPHGGLVYVTRDRAWDPTDEESLTVEIRGAVPAAEAGADGARHAPWGEIEGEHVVLALPREVLATVEDAAAVAAYWDAVWGAQVELLGEPISDRKERLVADVQISAGYMHAGYPIMTHLDGGEVAVDLARLRTEGSWGHFHELGHNAQRPEWTFAGTGEVTCNLFTLYTMEKVVGIPTQEHPRVVDQRAKAAAYREAGGDFERWKREPFLALAMYAELQAEFGWGAFRDVFREYAALPAGERPRGDGEERDQWCVRLSRTVGRDLTPFFRDWAVPLGPTVVEEVAGLPPWEGPR